jgi:hypothetical protein
MQYSVRRASSEDCLVSRDRRWHRLHLSRPTPACHSQLAATAKNRCPSLPGHRGDIAAGVPIGPPPGSPRREAPPVAIPRQVFRRICGSSRKLRPQPSLAPARDVRHSCIQEQPREELLEFKENGQIRPSNPIHHAWNRGADRTSNPTFQPVQKTPIILVSPRNPVHTESLGLTSSYPATESLQRSSHAAWNPDT